jgi:hypothetical protein
MLNTLTLLRPTGMNHVTNRDGFATCSARFTRMALAGMGLISLAGRSTDAIRLI